MPVKKPPPKLDKPLPKLKKKPRPAPLKKKPRPAMPAGGKRHRQALEGQANKHLTPGPGGITFTEREWLVEDVLTWRLNYNKQQLEWYTKWETGECTWEPNAGSGGYSRLIYYFLQREFDSNEMLKPLQVVGCRPCH